MKSIELDSKYERSKEIKPYIIFLLNPLFSFFYAIKNYRASWAKNIVWLFTIFCGFTFIINIYSGTDSLIYVDDLKYMHNSKLTLDDITNTFYSDAKSQFDLYQPVLTLIVSRFTDDYRILFAIYGLFLGYFYSRNIWLLIEKINTTISKYGVLLIITFAMIMTIGAGINGVRFNTAVHVFVFGILNYFLVNKKIGLAAILLTPLIHFSFLIAISVFLFYLFVGNRLYPYFIFFVISYFVSIIQPEFVKSILSYLPSGLVERTDLYTGKYFAPQYGISGSSKSWFLTLGQSSFKYSIFILAVFVFYKRKTLVQNKYLLNLFNFALLSYGFSNIISVIPSVGRFLAPSGMIIFALFFLFSEHFCNIFFKRIILIVSPVLLLLIFINLRIWLSFVSPLIFLSNPFIAPFIYDSVGFYEFYFK